MPLTPPAPVDLHRRNCLKGLLQGAALPGLAWALGGCAALGQGPTNPLFTGKEGSPEQQPGALTGSLAGALTGTPPVLKGNSFDLVVSQIPVNLAGRPQLATLINGHLPAPTLHWQEGETVRIRVINQSPETTSIHWHGILLPYQMDGVPGISFPGIAPGETFTYHFKVQQHGTYWYHAHSGMQELLGMYGALVVHPANPAQAIRAERDHVVVLSDWGKENPMQMLRKLRTQSNYYNHHQPTVAKFLQDAQRTGWAEAWDERQMWNDMRMSPADVADLSSEALVYLCNGRTPQSPWTGLFNKGERVRLRFINASGNTFYDVRIPGLKLKMVQADGVNMEPVSVDEFRFGPGETYDALIEPKEEAYTLFAQSMDRTGYALGTLAVQAGLSAPVPALDKPQWLSMTDMMGSMETPNPPIHHATAECGPGTDMRVDTPRTNLDDPGVGLRDNGRRVLTLADIHTLGGPLDKRPPTRELELHLTGNMERYSWSLNGLRFNEAAPLRLKYGERLRVVLHNDTMMTHPMHLHGMWSELESPEGQFQARRHTLPVQPAQRISFLLTADALGHWAWHCHLMFHMEMGMFREVIVA
jgi:FtsP/CotA-like multicopper oxidase with cupredoxin domain